MKKTYLEQIINWLLEDKIDFAEIASVYVRILEEKNKDNYAQIRDLAFIATMYRDPKTNAGTKKTLENRFSKAIMKSKVFEKTKFEEKLLKTL